MKNNARPNPPSGTHVEKRRHFDPKKISISLERLKAADFNEDLARSEYLSEGRGPDGNAHSEWVAVMDLLDQTDPDWSCAIHELIPIGKFVVVVAVITIHEARHKGVSVGLGGDESQLKILEQEALIQAAPKFGGRRKNCALPSCDLLSSPIDPIAKTEGELILPGQLSLIDALAQRARQDAETLCYEAWRARVPEISRRAASVLIEYILGQILLDLKM